MTRQLPKFRPSKFTVIAVGGAFCLAAAGSVSAVTLSSYATNSNSNASAAAGLTSAASQAEQHVAPQAMAVTAQRAAAEKAAAQAHAAHAAHQQHSQLLAARAAAARAAAKRAAAEKAAAKKAARQRAAAPSGSPQQIAQELLNQEGEGSQFSCLDSLWQHESGWNVSASNPGSGAYGIPQALPGSRMASAGPDWQSNAETQIKWGLQYIQSTYGSPCSAWSHEQSSGWY